MKSTRLILLTILAMIAFAGNSLLCRAALRDTAIDAASFTFIRLSAGALVLYCIWRWQNRGSPLPGSWLSALALFVYAAAFSLAYLTLAAGTGAMLLFGAVQATMIFGGLRRGEGINSRQICGLILAAGGLAFLLFPGISAPSWKGTALMLAAGLSWGIYSLRGREAGDPIATTAGNFIRSIAFAFLFGLAFLGRWNFNAKGVGYAIVSGGISSGLGYCIWYSVLPALRATTAAVAQLSVPILAAAGGILLLGEAATWRFGLASIAVLGGIALAAINPSTLSAGSART